MLFLGLILAAAAVALGAAVVIFDTGPAHLTLFDHQVPGIDAIWQVFLAGAITAALFVVAMIMLWVGFGRMLSNRRDLRHSLNTLELEKRQLQDQLDRAQRGDGSGRPSRRGRGERRGDGPVPGEDAARGDGPAPGDRPRRRPGAPTPVPAGVGPARSGAGPQVRPDATRPVPRPDGTGPAPRPNATGPLPRPDGTGPVPRPDGTGPVPRPNGTGPVPRPNNTGPVARPDGTGPRPMPEPDGDGPARGRRRRRPAPAPAQAGGAAPRGPRIDVSSPFFDRAD